MKKPWAVSMETCEAHRLSHSWSQIGTFFFSSPSHILNHQTSPAHYACRTNKQASEKVNMSGNTIVDGARWASEIIADWTNKRFGGNFAGSYESSDISDTAHLTEGKNRTVSQEGSFRMFPSKIGDIFNKILILISSIKKNLAWDNNIWDVCSKRSS